LASFHLSPLAFWCFFPSLVFSFFKIPRNKLKSLKMTKEERKEGRKEGKRREGVRDERGGEG
jgi:hypothetical protein